MHKKEVKGFVDEYLEAYQKEVEQKIAEYGADQGKYYQESFDDAKENLELLFENVDLPKLIKSISKKNINDEAFEKSLSKLVKTSSIVERWSDEYRPQLVKIAADTNTKQALLVIQALDPYQDRDYGRGEDNVDEESVELVFSAEEKAHWRKLMQLPFAYHEQYGASTYQSVGLMVKSTFVSYNSPDSMKVFRFWGLFSLDEQSAMLGEFVEDYFSGEKQAGDSMFVLPEEEKIGKLEENLSKLSGKEISQKIPTLEPGEKLLLLRRKQGGQSAADWWGKAEGLIANHDNSYCNSNQEARKSLGDFYHTSLLGEKYDVNSTKATIDYILKNSEVFQNSLVSFADASRYTYGINMSVASYGDASYYKEWIPNQYEKEINAFKAGGEEVGIGVAFFVNDEISGSMLISSSDDYASYKEKLSKLIEKSISQEQGNPYLCFYVMTKDGLKEQEANAKEAEEAEMKILEEEENLEGLKNLLKLK